MGGKNKTAFTLVNDRDQLFPKGWSVVRVSFQLGPYWSLLILLSYVRPHTYQICIHVVDHISHSLTQKPLINLSNLSTLWLSRFVGLPLSLDRGF